MSAVALCGNDSFVLNGRSFSDFADGDFSNLEFPNDIASLKTGKNGNTIYALNNTGKQANVTLRLIRGSADDKYMNSMLIQMRENFPSFILMNGTFIKKIGDGQGNVASDTYIMSGGIFTKQVNIKSNEESDTEQAVSIYTLSFSNAPRAIR